MQDWAANWGNDPRMKSLLNRRWREFYHEIDEYVVPLHYLMQCLESREALGLPEKNVVIVEFGAGKGYLSLLISSLAAHLPVFRRNIRSIVMIDKNKKTNWKHLSRIKEEQDGIAPIPIDARIEDLHSSGINTLLSGLTDERLEPIVIGIHLCKQLSSRFIQIYNLFPSIFALLLAPCCLPNPTPLPLTCGLCAVFSADLFAAKSPYACWTSFLLAAISSENKLIISIREREDFREATKTTASVNDGGGGGVPGYGGDAGSSGGGQEWQKHVGNKCLFACRHIEVRLRDYGCIQYDCISPITDKVSPTNASPTVEAVHFAASEADEQYQQRALKAEEDYASRGSSGDSGGSGGSGGGGRGGAKWECCGVIRVRGKKMSKQARRKQRRKMKLEEVVSSLLSSSLLSSRLLSSVVSPTLYSSTLHSPGA
jgi:uncharacterized membrane protein YgcG